MPSVFSALIAYVVSHVRSHQSLRLENMALRHHGVEAIDAALLEA